MLAAAEIRDEATRNGVPGSLAAAIAWQESGFNNAMVSAANARGVMQVMPRYVGLGAEEPGRLAAGSQLPAGQRARGRPLPRHAPALRGRRPRDRGGLATNQGPASVARIGMLPETRRYVDNVSACAAREEGTGDARAARASWPRSRDAP